MIIQLFCKNAMQFYIAIVILLIKEGRLTNDSPNQPITPLEFLTHCSVDNKKNFC